MTQYIDKSALVAEIEKLEELYCYGKSDGVLIAKSVFDSVKNVINTLEVKEVDFDAEVEDYIENTSFTTYDLEDCDIKMTAKHFFELGIKAAQK